MCAENMLTYILTASRPNLKVKIPTHDASKPDGLAVDKNGILRSASEIIPCLMNNHKSRIWSQPLMTKHTIHPKTAILTMRMCYDFNTLAPKQVPTLPDITLSLLPFLTITLSFLSFYSHSYITLLPYFISDLGASDSLSRGTPYR